MCMPISMPIRLAMASAVRTLKDVADTSINTYNEISVSARLQHNLLKFYVIYILKYVIKTFKERGFEYFRW